MPLVASKKPLNATYRSDLTGPARVRYAEKVRLCDNEDRFILRPGTDTAGDVDLFPEISYGDILNYLVFSANFLTLEEMKAFKATEAHNYFTSGWVKSLSAKQLQDDKVLLLGRSAYGRKGMFKNEILRSASKSHADGLPFTKCAPQTRMQVLLVLRSARFIRASHRLRRFTHNSFVRSP
ncbi:hypothetical protein HPB51_020530 [Rhipicephalus microplus]|uniref:Uncharacterized protein n=1 Tax=Rhipicephalus microplus TaxID=6941 RepID=A0A9J6EUN7_RHIMP|nr:hypothetical protein HPB51_020530 [Rhipicephalus microplus]